MYRFKVGNIRLNTSSGIMEICPRKINVIVGPNNSGKSRLLREIRDYLSGDRKDIRIIDDIEFNYPESFEVFDNSYDITTKMKRDQYGNWVLRTYSNKPTQMLDLNSSFENYYTRNVKTLGDNNWIEYFKMVLERKDKDEFFDWFGPLFYQYIGTEEKLTICKTQRNYGLDSNSTNYLTFCKYQNNLLADLSNKTKEYFGKDIFLDTHTLGDRLVFRVGDDFSQYKSNISLSEEMASFLLNEPTLDTQGDGLKSFVSTFLSINRKETDVLLIDEPEAFLHPPLARRVGEIIGGSHNDVSTVFVATHSVEILKGILSKNQDVNVIRIVRQEENTNNIVKIDNDTLSTIITNPLLRVSRVLEGLFCEKVVLTEAEADELIYQEIAEIIMPESGAYYVHGQNKQTLAHIAEMYQKIGVQYEIVTDFDVLKNTEELTPFLQLMSITESERGKIIRYSQELRKQIEENIDKEKYRSNNSEKDSIKKQVDEVYHRQGISSFDNRLKTKIRDTLSMMSKNHLHILETGELETILVDCGVEYSSEKSKWVIRAIEKIGTLSRSDLEGKYITEFVCRFLEN